MMSAETLTGAPLKQSNRICPQSTQKQKAHLKERYGMLGRDKLSL